MYHGKKNNEEIEQLLQSGTVAFGDTVFSTSWNETLTFTGMVFSSYCACKYVGHFNPCSGSDSECEPVTESFAVLTL